MNTLLRSSPASSKARSSTRPAGEVLVVSRLLADQHQCRRDRSLPGDDLRGIAIERTACALCFSVAKLAQRGDLGGFRAEKAHVARRLAAVSKTAICCQCSWTAARRRSGEHALGLRNANGYIAPAICGGGIGKQPWAR